MGGFWSQSFPPKPQWTAADIPDLSGKVVLVTGANIGIGKETAKELLAHNAKVYVAARDKAKADAAIAELKSVTGKENVHFLELDLADLHSVKRAAEEFISRESKLNILFASAGVMVPPIDLLTKQGYDLQLGTNALGHWYFTKLLIPVLRAGAEEGFSRVVTVSSIASEVAKPINWETFKDGAARTKFGTNSLYGQSKLMNVILTREFAKRYGDSGIVFSSLNPGNIKSGLQRHVPSLAAAVLNLFLYDVSYGALTSLYAGTSPDATINGAYYVPWARAAKAAPLALDSDTGIKSWDWMEEQVKGI
ncbi:NAD(P)-binding protein [Auricularia subglabra TFB-10046 SS5]|nr:NAD(P)-binding protein [Auricularia subglabra TFB-10046 SS5]